MQLKLRQGTLDGILQYQKTGEIELFFARKGNQKLVIQNQNYSVNSKSILETFRTFDLRAFVNLLYCTFEQHILFSMAPSVA